MRLIGKNKLIKLKARNKGNRGFVKALDKLILDIENANWESQREIKIFRSDADQVHEDGFFFFNIQAYRALILIEFEATGEATIIWVGNHKQYEQTFRNNKDTIRKWLRIRGYIS